MTEPLDVETKAINGCLRLLTPLSRDARHRVMDYLRSRVVMDPMLLGLSSTLMKAMVAVRDDMVRARDNQTASLDDVVRWIDELTPQDGEPQ